MRSESECFRATPKALSIDVGCGLGTRYAGWTGLDCKRQEWLKPERAANSYRMVDLEKPLPFRDSTVANALLLNTLEHFTRTKGVALLSEIRRVLRPGGRVLVSVPDVDVLLSRYVARDVAWFDGQRHGDGTPVFHGATLLDKAYFILANDRPGGHKYGFNEASLLRVMEDSGLYSEPVELSDRFRSLSWAVSAEGVNA